MIQIALPAALFPPFPNHVMHRLLYVSSSGVASRSAQSSCYLFVFQTCCINHDTARNVDGLQMESHRLIHLWLPYNGICSRSLCKDAKNGCIPEMGHDMLGQKARSKKAQTPELQSTATVEYLYPDNPAVYDSIRFRHSSAIVTMS